MAVDIAFKGVIQNRRVGAPQDALALAPKRSLWRANPTQYTAVQLKRKDSKLNG